ncbi:MAG: FMN-dependent NADH-azoreductase [Arenicella sp.]
MSYILRIDSSPRSTESHSRRIANYIENALLAKNSELHIRRRDLAAMSIPHINNDTIAGFFTPDNAMTTELQLATALSNELISELKDASILIISAPIYNFSTPSALKAWIDQIVRINATFSYDGESFTGLVSIKQVYLALSYGASGYADQLVSMNFLEPYLVSLMNFLGMDQVDIFTIEGTTGDENIVAAAHSQLELDINRSIL